MGTSLEHRRDQLPGPTSAAAHERPRAEGPDVHQLPAEPLRDRDRRSLERRFSYDFSNVRIHADGRAAAAADAVGATAFTYGPHVVFGAGRYQPGTAEGSRLLAHELAHVVQQGDISTTAAPVGVAPANGSAERLAHRAADAALAGRRVRGLGPAGSVGLLHRQEGTAEGTPTGPPESLPEDGQFWVLHRAELATRMANGGLEPLLDEESHAVIGFKTRGSVQTYFDLDGRVVGVEEPGLESPLIDPIDILSGGLAGLGRGVFGRAAARGVARAGAVAAARGTIRSLAGSLTSAMRSAFRAVRFRGALNFTATTTARMADPARRVPIHILKLAIRYGRRAADPQRVAGAFRYTTSMYRGVRNAAGEWVYREYTLEVVLREADQTVLHFLYR